MRGETLPLSSSRHSRSLFQSTPLMRGETRLRPPGCTGGRISIHSPHARGDGEGAAGCGWIKHFNPLPSCEGRLWCATRCGTISTFQSTPLIRGETRKEHGEHEHQHISIHSPHARGDTSATMIRVANSQFQSTPLMRGETTAQQVIGNPTFYFNPLPSCEGRLSRNRRPHIRTLFQSTPLMRGETADAAATGKRLAISIHSPHARGDRRCIRPHTGLPTISIHSPHARGDL